MVELEKLKIPYKSKEPKPILHSKYYPNIVSIKSPTYDDIIDKLSLQNIKILASILEMEKSDIQ